MMREKPVALQVRNQRHFVSESGGHRESDRVLPDVAAVLHVDSGRIPLRGNEQIGRFVWCRQTIDLGAVEGAVGSVSFLLYEASGNSEALNVDVNGHALELKPDRALQGYQHWRTVELPQGVLRDGGNELLVWSDNLALNSWALGIAVSDAPVSSKHSFDRGRSWHSSGLGTDQSLMGDYAIRWHVFRAPDTFWVRTAVVASVDGAIGVSGVDVMGQAEGLEYRGGEIIGGRVVWQAWDTYRDDSISAAAVQLRARIGSDALFTGISMMIKGEYVLVHPYAADVVLEDPTAEATLAVRKELSLDAVIAGTNTDLERAAALSSWIHEKWIHRAGTSIYSPWHAPTIFAWQAAKEAEGIADPIGFCVHFAVSLVQCASALGMKARAIILGQRTTEAYGGHFVAEIWCSELDRWVCFDPDFDYHWLVDDEPAGVADVHMAVVDGREASVKPSPGRLFTRNPMGESWPLKHVHEGGYLWFGLPLNQAWLSDPRTRLLHHGAVNYHEVEVLWFDPNGALSLWAPNRTSDVEQFLDWRV